jgi:glutathione synthase/RimK-type ligase-like ATP-grasp enzyme
MGRGVNRHPIWPIMTSMKLVLANNQSEKFVKFHDEVQTDERFYDYSGYDSLLFYFDETTCTFTNITTGKSAQEYDGVYLNGYLTTPEVAFSAATVLGAHNVPFVNSELQGAPSLTKLSSYAKLSAAGVRVPMTYAGMATALTKSLESDLLPSLTYPCIVKRADADRGIDNFILKDKIAVLEVLRRGDDRAIWLVQEFIPNDGFYVATYYHDTLEFGVFRAHMERTDKDATKQHMFKPKGGINASFLTPENVPSEVAELSLAAAKAMRREVASVDVVLDRTSGKPYVLEVNYNPQLVTVSVFRDERTKSFLKGIKHIE